MKFRYLRADEVDCRVATCTEKGVSILLYKDARCDMNILDETVGSMFWQRHHSRDNANCTVSIFCKELDMWIEKEDTGTESNTEAEKGLASDSFKRACFNWGIGRELYTAPFIWVSSDKCNITNNPRTGKPTCNDKFIVSKMTVEDGKIADLEVSVKGNTVFSMNHNVAKNAKKSATVNKQETEQKQEPRWAVEVNNGVLTRCCEVCGKPLTEEFSSKCAIANRGHIWCSKTCKEKGLSNV